MNNVATWVYMVRCVRDGWVAWSHDLKFLYKVTRSHLKVVNDYWGRYGGTQIASAVISYGNVVKKGFFINNDVVVLDDYYVFERFRDICGVSLFSDDGINYPIVTMRFKHRFYNHELDVFADCFQGDEFRRWGY